MAKTSSRYNDSAMSQAERFRETARQLECDEDKERFEEKLGKIARHRPADQPAGASSSSGGKPRRARNRPGSE